MGAYLSSQHPCRHAAANEAQDPLLNDADASSETSFVTASDGDDSYERVKVDLMVGPPDDPMIIVTSEACFLRIH